MPSGGRKNAITRFETEGHPSPAAGRAQQCHPDDHGDLRGDECRKDLVRRRSIGHNLSAKIVCSCSRLGDTRLAVAGRADDGAPKAHPRQAVVVEFGTGRPQCSASAWRCPAGRRQTKGGGERRRPRSGLDRRRDCGISGVGTQPAGEFPPAPVKLKVALALVVFERPLVLPAPTT